MSAPRAARTVSPNETGRLHLTSMHRETGSYAHMHGSDLRFSGTIAESNRDAITVHAIGRVSA